MRNLAMGSYKSPPRRLQRNMTFLGERDAIFPVKLQWTWEKRFFWNHGNVWCIPHLSWRSLLRQSTFARLLISPQALPTRLIFLTVKIFLASVGKTGVSVYSIRQWGLGFSSAIFALSGMPDRPSCLEVVSFDSFQSVLCCCRLYRLVSFFLSNLILVKPLNIRFTSP